MNELNVKVENPDNLAPVYVDGLVVRDSGDVLVLAFTMNSSVAVEVLPTINIKALVIVTPEFAGKIAAAIINHGKKMLERKKGKGK
jgi:hypothetical protein